MTFNPGLTISSNLFYYNRTTNLDILAIVIDKGCKTTYNLDLEPALPCPDGPSTIIEKGHSALETDDIRLEML